MSNKLEKKKIPPRARLGRGLGSLLGENTRNQELAANTLGDDVELQIESFEESKNSSFQAGFVETNKTVSAKVENDGSKVWNISIEKLKGNKKQPRKVFATEPLKELAASIKEKGILQPIVARRLSDGSIEIIAGERRWRAAQLAGLHEVPVILRDLGEQDTLELALIENIQRQDLNPLEEAQAYQYLLQTYNMTQQELANKVGKERATVANSVRILNLTPEVQKLIGSGDLSLGQAKILLTVSDPNFQRRLALKTVKEKLTVKALERFAKNPALINGAPSQGLDSLDMSAKLIDGLSQELQKLLGTKVSIQYSKGKGKVKINFYSDEELNSLVDKVRAICKK